MTIKSLLIKIGADVTELQTNLAKADGYIQDHAKQFKQIGTVVTVAGAAITGAIGGMVKQYVKAGSELLEMSQRTGMSTTALSELKYVAKLCGTDLNTIELAVKKMAGSLYDASTGSDTAKAAFTALGLNIDELMALTPDQQFDKIAKAIARIENPTVRAALAGDMFGERVGTKLLPMLADGEAGFEAMKQEAHKLGLTFKDEDCREADALGDSIDKLKGSFTGIGNTVAKTLAPIITDLATTISNVIIKVREWMDEHPGLTTLLAKVGLAVGVLATVLGPIIMMLPLLAGGFALLTGPIGLVVAAIAGLIAIGTLVVTHWTEIKQFFIDAWTAIKDFGVEVWEGIKTVFLTVWTAIKDFLIGLWDGLKTAVTTVWNAIHDFFVGLWDKIKAIFTGAWDTIKTGFSEFGTGIKDFVQNLVEKIVEKFMWLWNKVKEITTWIKDHTIGIFKKMWDKVSGHSLVPEMVDDVINNFIRMRSGIGQVLDDVDQKTKTVFGTVADYAQAMATSGSESSASFAENLKGSVRGMLKTLEGNAIAFIIAKVMAALPFPWNLIAVAGAIAAVKTLFGAIKLAEGGIVTGPTLAMIGERGPEAVIPLDRAGGFGMGGAFSLRQNNYFYGNISSKLDIDEISRRLAERTMQAVSKGRRGY